MSDDITRALETIFAADSELYRNRGFMRRVGFDAFAVRPDKDDRQALHSLQPFSDAYQGSWDNAIPAFRRHVRAWPAPHGN